MDIFCLQTEISELPIGLPHEQDKWIMKVFVECEFTDDELLRLNRVRCNQQVIFYSNVFDAGGSALDRRRDGLQEKCGLPSSFRRNRHQPRTTDYGSKLYAS